MWEGVALTLGSRFTAFGEGNFDQLPYRLGAGWYWALLDPPVINLGEERFRRPHLEYFVAQLVWHVLLVLQRLTLVNVCM